MKTILFLFPAILMAFQISLQVSHDEILGTWANEDKSRTLEFVKNKDSYDAIIRSAENASLVGKKQITGLKPAGENTFENGTLYLFKKKKTAPCSAKLLNSKTLELKATVGFFSQSQTWTKR